MEKINKDLLERFFNDKCTVEESAKVLKWFDTRDRRSELSESTVVQGTESLVTGLDTRDSHMQDWNGSITGFHMKKFLDPVTEPADDP